MKYYFLFFIMLFVLSVSARKKKQNIVTKGKVIVFQVDSMSAFTDSATLINLLSSKYSRSETKEMMNQKIAVRDFVLKQLAATISDTLILANSNSDRFRSLNGSQYYWDIKDELLQLIKSKNVKIIDKHGKSVKSIIVKKKGFFRYFINQETKEVLFLEPISPPSGNPSF